MMNRFTLIFMFLAFAQLSMNSQLPWGADAPDWSLTDLDGNVHTLSDYLNDGKTVYLTFSATWCFPCWNYHNSGAMDQMWDENGPAGTDEAMVLFIEADLGTPESCLFGSCGNTQGDWVSNTNYPIINLTNSNGPNTASDYQISGFPTVYVVCPSGKAYVQTVQPPFNTLESFFNSCQMQITDLVTTSETCPGTADGSVDLTFTSGLGASDIEWSNGATTEDISNLSAGTYTVTITDDNDVFVEGEAIVAGAEPIEINDVVFDNMVDCFGATNATIEVELEGGAPGYSVEWEDGSTSLVRNNLGAGNYSVTVTDQNNCQEDKDYVIDQPDPLSTSLSATNENCDQSDGLIICAPAGGTAPYQYDIGGGPQSNNVFAGLSAGSYTITVTDANACDITESATITNAPGPEAIVPANQELDCDGTTIIDASASVPGSGTTIQWTTADGNIVSGGNTLIPEVDAEGTYVLTLNNNSTGCFDEASATVAPAPVQVEATASASGLINCNNTEVTLNSSGSSSGVNIIYSWVDADGNEISTDATVQVNVEGDYTLIVTDTVFDCSSEDLIVVQSDTEQPTVDVEGVDALDCSQNEITVQALVGNTGANTTISWKDADGNEIGTGMELVISQAGNYSVEVTNNDNGCSVEEPFMIDSNGDLPTVDITAPSTNISCQVTEVSLDASNSSSGANFEYSWTTTDGNIVSGADELIATVDAAGTYTLNITNTDNGCVGTNQVEVIGYTEAPEASTTVEIEELVVTVNADIIGVATDVLWDFGDGTTSSDLQTAHEYADEGTYQVCLSVSNDCGNESYCEDVVVSRSTALGASGNITNVSCFGGADGAIDVTITGGMSPYSVSWSNGASSEDISNLEAGTYVLEITDAEGTTIDQSFEVQQPNELVSANVEIENSETGMDNGSINIEIEGGVSPYTYLWSNGATEEDITGLAPGSYTLDVTDANNCTKAFGPYVVELASNTIELSSLVSAQLSPNPASYQAILEVKFNQAFELDILIFDLNGKRVYEQRLPMAEDFRVILPSANWQSGMYFVQLMTREGVQTMPLIKH